VTLQKLNELTKELNAHEKALSDLQATIAREKQRLDQARKIKQELDLKLHEIKLTEEQIGGNSSSSIIQDVENMKQSIVQLRSDFAAAKKRQEEAAKDIRRIEKDMKEFDNNKDGKLVELQSSIDTLRRALCKNAASVKALQKELQSARLDSEQFGGDLAAAQEHLQDSEQTLKAQDLEITVLLTEQARVKVC
jgi:structural maintenance of chromosome 2